MFILACVALAGTAGAQGLVGKDAPAFSVMSSEGKRVFLKDLLGERPIFLFFINDRDAVSSQAAPYIHRIIRTYSPGKSRWFGVMNSRADRARSWNAQFNAPYRLFMDEDLTMVRQFQVENSPTVVMISPEGKVVREWRGFSGYWLKDLNRAVAQANGQKFKYIDFNRTPSTTRYGANYIMNNAGGGG